MSSSTVEVNVTLKIPRGYYDVAQVLAKFWGKDFDDYVSQEIKESIDTFVADPEVFHQEILARLGKTL